MSERANIPTESRWTREGFMQRYEELCKVHDTYYKAYIACEGEHKTLFGDKRYSSYDSFRVVRNKWLIGR